MAMKTKERNFWTSTHLERLWPLGPDNLLSHFMYPVPISHKRSICVTSTHKSLLCCNGRYKFRNLWTIETSKIACLDQFKSWWSLDVTRSSIDQSQRNVFNFLLILASLSCATNEKRQKVMFVGYVDVTITTTSIWIATFLICTKE